MEHNGSRLAELLREELTNECLEHALIAAVNNDNPFNVGQLVTKGATNIEECLIKAMIEKKHNARAMLLLIKAARENDKDLVLKLFGASGNNHVSQS